jgi:hypothetical protein
MANQTHFRKVFKSDYLGSADIEEYIEEGKSTIFTISHVKQEIDISIAGKKGNHNIAYFVEKVKPMVLNSTNCKIVKLLAGGSPFVENWKNITVEVYIDSSVRMKGEVVGGIRLKAAIKTKPNLILNSEQYTKAAAHLLKGGSIEDIAARYTLSDEVIKSLNNAKK